MLDVHRPPYRGSLARMTIRAVHHINCATMCPAADSSRRQGPRSRPHDRALPRRRDGEGWLVSSTRVRHPRCRGAKDGLAGGSSTSSPQSSRTRATRTRAAPALGYRADDVRTHRRHAPRSRSRRRLPDFPTAKVHVMRASTRPSSRSARQGEEPLPARPLAPRAEMGGIPTTRYLARPARHHAPARHRRRLGLVPLHGHTRGHSAVIVRDPSAGSCTRANAYFHHHSVDGAGAVPLGFWLFERATQIDGVKRKASLAALRTLRESHADVAMFCAHDPHEYATMRARASARAAS